jgi:predicted NUDIX family NTP pyrophosphohydrolase
MFRRTEIDDEVFLVHPGGPYWAKKGKGFWTLPKGECEPGEDLLDTARREFHEETGFHSAQPFLDLGSVQQKSGKTVFAWAFEGDCDPAQLTSNTCEIQWPPRSGKHLIIPEIDEGEWFTLKRAHTFIRAEQQPLLDRLQVQIPKRALD